MIQIIRLKNGEDIIGQVMDNTSDYEIDQPMSVSVEYHGRESGLVMHHWLPIQLIDKNTATIKKEDVLTTFHPNNEFKEYYKNTVKKLNDILNAKKIADEMTDEEIAKVEQIVNEKIMENIALDERRNVPIEEAKKIGATALFGEKYGEFVD